MSTNDPIALFRSELRTAAERQITRYRRRRWILTATVAIVGVLGAGTALAANSWLSGEPAPPAVVADFNSYTPQLGFRPDAGSAVLVAQDGNSSLYATTNSEGSYCIVVDAPWRRAGVDSDGGTCVGQSLAKQKVVAGIVSISPGSDIGSDVTMLVAGRIDVPNAGSVTLISPSGEAITRSVGSSGFFLAAIPAKLCTSGWTSSFAVSDDQGQVLTQTDITLVHQLDLGSGRKTCWMPLSSENGPFMRISTGVSGAS
jgi:hypothetical protein